jgi:hypothetical protein
LKLHAFIFTTFAGQSVDVLLQQQDAPFKRHHLINSTGRSNSYISALMLGDFNGDVHMDLLLASSPIGGTLNQPVSVDVFISNHSTLAICELFY